MKNLIIIGARGFGREALLLAHKLWYKGIIVKGFLDDNPLAFEGLNGKFPPILSSVEDYIVQKNDYFFCALGDPIQRKKYSEIIENKGGKFLTIISPRASVAPTAKIGDGSFIDEYVCISDNANIGKHCIILRMATIGHDISIGDNVTIGADVFCGGGSTIGNVCTINPKAFISKQIKIGNNSIIGAGSIVVRNVSDGSHMFGNPAKKIPYMK